MSSEAVGTAVIPLWACTTIEGLASGVRTFVSANTDPPGACSPNPRRSAHEAGQCYSPLNGNQEIFALLGYDDIRTLEGKLLTIVDASFTDREQRKAVKDLVRQTIWFNWVKYLDTDQPSGGMPDR
jgi:predicted kinase